MSVMEAMVILCPPFPCVCEVSLWFKARSGNKFVGPYELLRNIVELEKDF